MDVQHHRELENLTVLGENFEEDEYFERIGIERDQFPEHLRDVKLSLYASFSASEDPNGAVRITYGTIEMIRDKSKNIISQFIRESILEVMNQIEDFVQRRDPVIQAKKVPDLPLSPVIFYRGDRQALENILEEVRTQIFTEYNSKRALLEFLTGEVPTERIDFNVSRYHIRDFIMRLRELRCFDYRDNWRDLSAQICLFRGDAIDAESLKRNPPTPSPLVQNALDLLRETCPR